MKTKKPLRQRFLDKITIDEPTGCWLWTAYIDKSGYGRFHRPSGSPMAHRYAYEEFVGPVADGLQLDHLCRVRHCVNPAHLEPVTAQENFARGSSFAAVNARKTHCDNGHELAGDNVRVVITIRRERVCVCCSRGRKRAHKQRRHAEGVAA